MTTSVAEAGQRLLQDDQPFDVAVLDGIVAAAYEPRHPERATANEILMKLREKPGCWQAADQIIEKSSLPQGRYFGLMALDDAINTRWKILPEGQRTGIKNFIVNKIISLSKDEESSMRERTMIHQMNKVLVSILKQEWPHNWPSFIGDICGASKNSEILCENNMHILRLLSEEVFDFSKDSMTTVRMRRPDAVAATASSCARESAPRERHGRRRVYAPRERARFATVTNAGQDPHPERISEHGVRRDLQALYIRVGGEFKTAAHQRDAPNAQGLPVLDPARISLRNRLN
jgi:hypothetical protein